MPREPTCRYFSKKKESTCPQKDFYACVHSSFIGNSPRCPSTGERINCCFSNNGYSLTMKRNKLQLREWTSRWKNPYAEYALMSPLTWHSRTSQRNLWWKEIRKLLASWGGGRDWRGSGRRELSGVMVNVLPAACWVTHMCSCRCTLKATASVHFIHNLLRNFTSTKRDMKLELYWHT